MSRLAVLGASGHGKVVADIAEITGWEQIDFFDDAWPGLSENDAWPVVGDFPSLCRSFPDYTGVVVAIGNNAIRAEKTTALLEAGAPIVNLIHPHSSISRYADIGVGVVVMAGVVVNCGTKVDTGAILNTGCTVDHDCILSDFVHISPGAHLAGSVQVGTGSWIGIGASVCQCLSIGKGVTVGAGAVVVSTIPDGVTAVGVPARYK